MKRLVLLVALAATLACGLVACGGSDEEGGGSTTASHDGGGDGGKLDLKIGFSGTLEGPYAAYDEPLLKGMEFAAEQVNRTNDRVNVEIVFKDNRGDQQEASSTMQELIDDGIRVFALTNGDALVAQGQLGQAVGAVMGLGASTAPSWVRDIGDGAFLFAFGDNGQAAAAARYACDQGWRTTYILRSKELPYLNNTPDYFADAFAHMCDGSVVGDDSFKVGQTEFEAQVTKIGNASPQPDFIYTTMFVPDSGVFLKALRGAGIELPFLGGDGDDSPLFAKSGGSAVDGVVFTTHGFPASGSELERFNRDFEAATGAAPESVFEALGADHVTALVAAAEAAGSTDPAELKEAVAHLEDVPLITGTLSMDPETRVPNKEVTLVRMKGTKPTFETSIQPDYTPTP